MNPSLDFADQPGSPLKRARPRLHGLRAMLALVACCGLMLWAMRSIWENRDGVAVEERAIMAKALIDLGSTDPAERLGAIQQFQRLTGGWSVALRPLIARFNDPDLHVRIAAIEAIGFMGSQLLRFRDDDAPFRDAAKELLALRHHPDPQVRASAVAAIGNLTGGYLGSSRSYSLQTATISTKGDGSTPNASTSLDNTEAAIAWATAGHKPLPPSSAITDRVDISPMIAAIHEALDDPDAKVRQAAIIFTSSLAPLHEPPKILAPRLNDELPWNRQTTVSILMQFYGGLDSWISDVVRVADQDPDPNVREAAFLVLNVVQPPRYTTASVPFLIKALETRSTRIRLSVIRALFKFEKEAAPAIPDLLRLFNEPVTQDNDSRQLGQAIAEALGKIAPHSPQADDVFENLIEVVKSGRPQRASQAALALSSLGKNRAEVVVPTLLQLIRDANPERSPNGEQEEAAARTLGVIAPNTPQEAEAADALFDLLSSKRNSTRYVATEALGRFTSKEMAAKVIPKLRPLENDPDQNIKVVTKRALLQLDGKTPF